METVVSEPIAQPRRGRGVRRLVDYAVGAFDFLTQGIFVGAMAFLLFIGWINRNEQVWVPDYGLGYALGIVGGTLMLMLLLYPIQKRWLIFGKWLKVKHFFRLHMVFGILGPVLILLHSNFHLGSVNGRVALFSMLIVALSGLVGRYIYTRIHHGLYGSRARFEDFRIESREISEELSQLLERAKTVKEQMVQLEQRVDKVPESLIPGMFFWTCTRLSAARAYRSFRRQLNRGLRTESEGKGWDRRQIRERKREVKHLLTTHKKAFIRTLEFRFYERMFSYWHVLHLPLFIMMVITGFVHVYAVHVY
jgi:hypothetical protein